MTKERFLNYTDAIVAIIATIMVLELPIPKDPTLEGLRQASSAFFAYLLSFSVIWAVWFNHHSLFKNVKKINARIYWYNGLWVFTMSLFPFSTAWVGRHPDSLVPELLYLFVIFFWSLAFSLMEHELLRENEYIRKATFYGAKRQMIYYLIWASGLVVIWFWPFYVILSIYPFVIYSIYMQIRYGGQY